VFRHQKKDSGAIDVAVDSALLSVGKPALLLFGGAGCDGQALVYTRNRPSRGALAECTTLAEASPRVFKALCETIGCDWGELWRVDPPRNVLRCTQPGIPRPANFASSSV